MATYNITSPDGQKYTINAPDDASQDDVLAYAQKNFKMAKSAPVEKRGFGAQFLEDTKQTVLAGLHGASGIGATLLAPTDAITGNKTRREDVLQSLKGLGYDESHWGGKGAKIATEIAGTAGIGGAVANGVTRLAPAALQSSPRFMQAMQSLQSGGFTLGSKSGTAAGKAVDVGVRAAGGAMQGGLQAGMVNPDEAGFGALIGGALPVGVQAGGKIAGGVGNAFRSINRPTEIKLASKLARSLGMSERELAAAVTQRGPEMLPGYRPTVPQILQDPVTSQLQRTLKTAGANGMGDAERVQQSVYRDALNRVAPVDLTPQDAANRAGGAIGDYAKQAYGAASKRVNAAFDAVDPFNESAILLPLDEMAAAKAKFLGAGTFGDGSKSAQALATARQVGTQELPAVKITPAKTIKTQSLEQAIRSQGGIHSDDILAGEVRGLTNKQSGTTGLVTKYGKSSEDLAQTMFERGFIPDNDPATLLSSLYNGKGRKIFANDITDDAFARQLQQSMGDAPLAQTMAKPVPFSTVQNLRSSMGEAAQQAKLSGSNKEAAALRQMMSEIDGSLNRVAGDGAKEGEMFAPDMVEQYALARKMHADKKLQFETGPQIGMFRQGADGQTAMQGAEIPGKFFSGKRSQVEDVQAFKRLIGNRDDLAQELKRFATTEASSTGDVQGNLTSKYLKWLESRSGANRELFTAKELATLNEVGKSVERGIRAENLGRVSGSDTAQKLEALNNLGLLDSKTLGLLANRIPVIGSFTGPALTGLRETAGRTRNNTLSGLLANPDDLAAALKPGTPQSNGLLEWMNKQGALASKAVPVIAAQ